MNIKKHIPNTITCGNLLCGCLAIVSAFKDDLAWSAYFVGIAAALDFFDGFTARLLNVHSEIGKQLDSLADMVTFGVVPGVVMYKLLTFNSITSKIVIEHESITSYIPYFAFLIPIFSALRLAKFNIDTRQTTSFIGVPTPANAILICSLPLILFFQPMIGNINVSALLSNSTLLILTLLMSLLLVAELPLFALKFKNFGWTDNRIRYSFIVVSLVLLFVFKFIAIPFIIFLYILISVVNTYTEKPGT